MKRFSVDFFSKFFRLAFRTLYVAVQNFRSVSIYTSCLVSVSTMLTSD